MADDNLNYRKIGKPIRRYRRAKNLSQEALAERINFSLVHIGHMETGAVMMSLSVLVCIANALNVSPMFCSAARPITARTFCATKERNCG